MVNRIGRKIKMKLILIILVLISSTSTYAQLQSTCVKDLLNSMFQSNIGFTKAGLNEVKTAAGILRYPKNVDPAVHPDGHLMYGFESEYTRSETAKILEIYGPEPKFNISKKQWLAKSTEERMEWLKVNLGDKPEFAGSSGLVKIVDEPGYEFLPKSLVHDSTGNVEFVLPPVNTLEQWEREMNLINKRFGTGSMQGMITTPRESFFAGTNATEAEAKKSLAANKGWIAFTSEMDAIDALEKGVVKLDKGSSGPVVPKFNHEYLGPLTLSKHRNLNKYLEKNANGEYFDAQSLEKIRTTESSFKYIGSSAYRPDIGGSNRIGFEIRHAHKDTNALIDNMVKNTFYMQESRDAFGVFSNLRAFDSVKDFEKLKPDVQDMLKDVFPTQAVPGAPYTAENLLGTEVYRNFAYPMRNWDFIIDQMPGLNTQQKMAYKAKIVNAQKAYLEKLDDIKAQLSIKNGSPLALQIAPISKNEAGIQIQKAIAEFSKESSVGSLFQSWHAGTVVSNPAWNTHVDSVLKEIQPFKLAYPESMWAGTLDQRIVQLQEKWPKNIKIVDDVKFKSEKLSSEAKRKVMGISLKGLTATEEARLLKDYTNAMAKGTVSFPVGERGGHLHTRMGDKDLDFYFKSDVAVNDYRFPSANRLEPFVALSPEEELRLRTHIDVTSDHGFNSVSKSSYQGVPSSQTKGTIVDNKPLIDGEGHNCTSWICTAKIGDGNKALHEIVGAKAEIDVHTNPGWWNSYLVSAATVPEKVPVVVYIEREKSFTEVRKSLEEAKKSNFVWDFAEH